MLARLLVGEGFVQVQDRPPRGDVQRLKMRLEARTARLGAETCSSSTVNASPLQLLGFHGQGLRLHSIVQLTSGCHFNIWQSSERPHTPIRIWRYREGALGIVWRGSIQDVEINTLLGVEYVHVSGSICIMN
jgi:hypothetical protein